MASPPLNRSLPYKVGRWLLAQPGDVREREYRAALEFFEGCGSVADIGCGTGTFLRTFPRRSVGVNINPDNVKYCKSKGLNVVLGNALEIPFRTNSFDGAFSSHVMQVFLPHQAAQYMKELSRIVWPGGIVVVATLNWFRRFFRHPENVRAYPPDALRRYSGRQHGASSPMYPGMPHLEQEAIWVRRPPLIEFSGTTSQTRERYAAVINRLQQAIGFRKYWMYDAYVVKLWNRK